MDIKEAAKKFWAFLQKDTWQSWIVSMILIVVFIKFIFFPALTLITGSSLPLVVVESCSMYHEIPFDSWWEKNAVFYEQRNITKSDFESFKFQNGLNKGDIIIVWGKSDYKIGDTIIFNAGTQHPLIHRLIFQNPLATKGDHNSDQLSIEKSISEDAVIGKGIARIPFIGWIKLIFFDIFNPPSQRGLCY